MLKLGIRNSSSVVLDDNHVSEKTRTSYGWDSTDKKSSLGLRL